MIRIPFQAPEMAHLFIILDELQNTTVLAPIT